MATPSKPAQKTARAVEGPRPGAAGNQARVHGERRRGAELDRDLRYTAEQRHEWHAMLVHIANERGYSPKWPRVNYREKFGDWPTAWDVNPVPPTPEVSSWVRSRLIAYAKRRRAA